MLYFVFVVLCIIVCTVYHYVCLTCVFVLTRTACSDYSKHAIQNI